MAVILFTNLKGGVAKTTNAIAVAECLASSGKRTLLIDADHQCTASELLLGEQALIKLDRKKRTLHDLLSEMLKPEFEAKQFDAYVRPSASNIGGGIEDLSVIPCSVRIDDFQTNYAKGGHGFHTWQDFRKLFNANRLQFRRWLKQFAYVIVDCPPSLSLQVKLFLGIADGYVVPCQPNRLSIRGLLWLSDRIHNYRYKTVCLGTLWSMCRGNDRMHKAIIEGAANNHAQLRDLPTPFETTVPLAANIAHAGELTDKQPKTFRAKYGTEFGRIYEQICEELMERVEALESERTEKRRGAAERQSEKKVTVTT
ncbi:ParA family protein [Rosistilla oblonga]|uniref:ParA family protein n=1 Tax=Rosistilla oblonga TaxID=2527990 RepID=UPI003A97F4A0